MSHDLNFKNLILDDPRQALAFFAGAEAADLLAEVRITPVRQAQLQERLGERFRELDVPLLVEWPDGRREAILFVLEEESDPARFSIHHLAHCCLDLSELLATERVVPSSSSCVAISPSGSWSSVATATSIRASATSIAPWPACPSTSTATATTWWSG